MRDIDPMVTTDPPPGGWKHSVSGGAQLMTSCGCAEYICFTYSLTSSSCDNLLNSIK